MNELPEGWTLTKFIDVFDIQGGTQPPKSTFKYEPQPSYIQLLQIRDFGERPVPTYVHDTDTLKKCTGQDILIARYGASLGRILTGLSGAYNVAMAKVDIPQAIDRRFVYYLLRSEIFQARLRLVSRSAQNGFNKQDIAEIELPIAPFKEQKRIADKLDTLFARLDVCNNRLEQMPMILKRFRQAVLAAATSGQLTEDWREQRGTSVKWEATVLGSIGSVTGGLIKNTKRLAFTLRKPYLRVANVYANRLELDDVTEIGLTEAEFQKTLLLKGDILIVEGNGSLDQIGRAAIWNEDISDCVHQNHLIRWRSNGNVLPKFALFWLLSPEGRASLVQLASTTTGLYNLSISKISSIPVRVPSLDEQNEIVHDVENLFAYADRLEASYQSARAKIECLTPALLAKAFRGELVSQDPNDESASLLLERIRAERAVQLAKPKIKAPRKPTMTKMTKESVREAIHQLPKDKFSFDELRENLTGDYDSLKDILFALLSEAEPILRQVFDQEERVMCFFRAGK